MLVDDHAVLREGIKFMVRNEPDLEVVAEAEDGGEALDMIEAAHPDVVLLDVNMPKVDGLEALRRIRSRWPGLPVLIFTAHDDPECVERALQSGASGYLLKAVRPEEVMRAVRAVFAGDGYLQAEITRPILTRFARELPTLIPPCLTTRETEVLRLLADGESNKNVARLLGISVTTVKGYLRDVFQKLDVSDRTHAVAVALRNRIID